MEFLIDKRISERSPGFVVCVCVFCVKWLPCGCSAYSQAHQIKTACCPSMPFHARPCPKPSSYPKRRQRRQDLLRVLALRHAFALPLRTGDPGLGRATPHQARQAHKDECVVRVGTPVEVGVGSYLLWSGRGNLFREVAGRWS